MTVMIMEYWLMILLKQHPQRLWVRVSFTKRWWMNWMVLIMKANDIIFVNIVHNTLDWVLLMFSLLWHLWKLWSDSTIMDPSNKSKYSHWKSNANTTSQFSIYLSLYMHIISHFSSLYISYTDSHQATTHDLKHISLTTIDMIKISTTSTNLLLNIHQI